MGYRFRGASASIATMAVGLLATAATAQDRINGKPDFNGIWQAANTAYWNLEAHSTEAIEDFWPMGALAAIPAGQSVVEGETIPYKPEALARREENRANWPASDPAAACYLPGIPRANYMPHPFQIIQGDSDIFFVYSFASANRTVNFSDVRELMEVPNDFWMGWSNGSWDGDTLVVETIANDDRTWLDRAGNYHSLDMVVEERFTLIDPTHIDYEVTITDPEVYTQPWTFAMVLYKDVNPNAELLEFKCVEFSENMLYGEDLLDPPEPLPVLPR